MPGSDFSEAFAEKFATAVDRAGMRVAAIVRPKDCVERPFTIMVAFDRPDEITGAGVQSTDWRIEYVASDAPNLAEGDEVEIDEVVYRVRRAPVVPEVGGVDGTFRHAVLTRVSTCAD